MPILWTVCGILTGLSLPANGEGIIAEISAYSEIETCPFSRCVMASGRRAYIGAVACPRTLKFGTRIAIGGLGEFVCEDRVSERLEGRYDIFMGMGSESYVKAKDFGIKKLKVEVIE